MQNAQRTMEADGMFLLFRWCNFAVVILPIHSHYASLFSLLYLATMISLC